MVVAASNEKVDIYIIIEVGTAGKNYVEITRMESYKMRIDGFYVDIYIIIGFLRIDG